MNIEQQQRAIQIWRKYSAVEARLLNASREYTQQELDQCRKDVIPEVLTALRNYLSGQTLLDEFKTQVDSINKRNRLWGFKGINGQMFFNMLTKTSTAFGKASEFDSLLKRALPVPASPEQAERVINDFAQFTKDLAKHVKDQRIVPKVGSINFFLSYFWQIQAPEQYPIFYTSMLQILQEYNLWSPPEDVGARYLAFYRLNHELLALFSQEAQRELTLWDVEHAFWYMTQTNPDMSSTSTSGKPEIESRSEKQAELPDSYIPPVVSILPRLAINDPEMVKLCQAMGTSVEKVFENRIDVLFKMLGYETQALGQGHGRVPDGVAICREFQYAIGYDAKVRQAGYTMGIDERAIREYINGLTERLKKQGIRHIYFMIISSSFSGDHDDVIRSLKMNTDAREILMVEVSALLVLLEARLRDPLLTLGQDGIQRLFASSGVLSAAEASEFRGL